ncbi:MAG: SDR family NAD(P)-dependent oxidoreductase [Clostridium sp.]|jgi:short-subunit dehydrogenase
MMAHRNKIAIVTGASSGMGRETAIQLADRFAGLSEIWLIARRRERLLDLERILPVPCRILPLDLTDERARDELSKELAAVKPDVKILVNASGFGKIGRVEQIPLWEQTGMIRLNCEALCAVTHLVLPYMHAGGRILQYASAAAFLPQPGFGVYAATKAFVLSYSRALGEELRSRRIFVTAVCPGPVRTEFFSIAETGGRIPLYKRLTMADPKKVVRLAIRDMMMGKPVSVYGPLMKLFRGMAATVPHSLIFRVMSVLSPEQVKSTQGRSGMDGTKTQNECGRDEEN